MNLQSLEAKVPSIKSWIEKTLSDHKSQTLFVSDLGFTGLPKFYSSQLLNNTKFISVPKVPVPPLSRMGLKEFLAFETGNYAGITYLDTYFIQATQIANESLHFHELGSVPNNFT